MSSPIAVHGRPRSKPTRPSCSPSWPSATGSKTGQTSHQRSRHPGRHLKPSLGADADLIEAAAWLHDIGYLPELAQTGLHGLDGARYLRDIQHAEPLLCRLVAHHSRAVIEAEERGLAHVMTREFAPPPQPLADALTFCDMTTSPDGEHVQVAHRLAEIHDRYGTGHLVSRFIRRATPLILEAVGQVNARTART